MYFFFFFPAPLFSYFHSLFRLFSLFTLLSFLKSFLSSPLFSQIPFFSFLSLFISFSAPVFSYFHSPYFHSPFLVIFVHSLSLFTFPFFLFLFFSPKPLMPGSLLILSIGVGRWCVYCCLIFVLSSPSFPFLPLLSPYFLFPPLSFPLPPLPHTFTFHLRLPSR